MKKALTVLTLLAMCLAACGCPGAGLAQDAQTPDLDLTAMSDTVAYAQVVQMFNSPDPYIGQIVSISGLFDAYTDENTGITYTACILMDATACCGLAFEFVWAGDHAYPDDYPEAGTEITVTGRFELYTEGSYVYIHLADAEVTWGE